MSESNVTKLFRDLRKEGFKTKQRAACCRTCAQVEDLQVYTTDQSKSEKSTFVYFVDIDGNDIMKSLAKLQIPFVWNGSNGTAFQVMDEVL